MRRFPGNITEGTAWVRGFELHLIPSPIGRVQAMIECQFTYPVPGTLLSAQARHVDFEERLYSSFGGYTRVEAVGGWRDGAITIVEAMFVYTIAVTDERFAEMLRDDVTGHLRTLGEKAMYFKVDGLVTITSLDRRQSDRREVA